MTISSEDIESSGGHGLGQNDDIRWSPCEGEGFPNENLTDIYLLRLAAANRGRLVTFDRSIRRRSVGGCAQEHLGILQGASTSEPSDIC